MLFGTRLLLPLDRVFLGLLVHVTGLASMWGTHILTAGAIENADSMFSLGLASFTVGLCFVRPFMPEGPLRLPM